MSCAVAELLCAAVGSTPTLMARVNAEDDSGDSTPVVQADVDSIVYSVRDLDLIDDDSEPTQTASGTLTVADVIFDTLQTGSIWDVDGVGYNFKFDLPTSAINAGEHRYRVYVTLTLADGGVAKWHYDVLGETFYGVDA